MHSTDQRDRAHEKNPPVGSSNSGRNSCLDYARTRGLDNPHLATALYRNARVDGRGILETDPILAENVRRIFQLFAYETCTLDVVVEIDPEFVRFRKARGGQATPRN
ncbi:MAG: hypothetical protein C0483_24215 [Pirellula sp.]|nr:hypothetical protein [Pirellula sp.]